MKSDVIELLYSTTFFHVQINTFNCLKVKLSPFFLTSWIQVLQCPHRLPAADRYTATTNLEVTCPSACSLITWVKCLSMGNLISAFSLKKGLDKLSLLIQPKPTSSSLCTRRVFWCDTSLMLSENRGYSATSFNVSLQSTHWKEHSVAHAQERKVSGPRGTHTSERGSWAQAWLQKNFRKTGYTVSVQCINTADVFRWYECK